MDPAQLKAQYDQTQFLTDQISKLDRDLLKTQNQQTDTILNSQERASYANENRANRNQQQIIDNVNDKAARITSTVERTGGDAVLATERTAAMLDTNQYRIAGQVDSSIYRTTSGLDANIYRTAAQTDQNIYRGNQDIRGRMAEQFSAVEDKIYNTQLEGQKSTNELIAYLKTNNDHNWSNFGNLTKDIYQGKADTILSATNQYAILAKQASDNVASIQMEALKNKADLAKQMAFEYSDLKNSIVSSESSIKDILRSQETDRLRDALRATEHKSLYFELKGDHHHHRHHGRHHGGHH